VDESSLVVLAYDHEASLRYITEHADSLAAVFVEPVQARRDLKRDPRAFLHSLRELTRHHGIVLIFDEVITGLRLGLGGVQARFGVQADLVAVGKALGAGSTPT
jgi:glutamate-1-semialdehyde aminotransferase